MKRILLATITKTWDHERARKSRFIWTRLPGEEFWRLRVLGVVNTGLHRIGLELHKLPDEDFEIGSNS